MTHTHATTFDNGQSYTAEDIHLGKRVFAYAMDALGVTLSLAIASCFAAWWSMLIAFILALLVWAAVELGAAVVAEFVVADDSWGAVGAAAYSVAGWFTKK